MTQRVPDDVVAKFTRQQHDWTERVLKGSLDPVEVARAVQDVINRGQKGFNPHAYFKNRNGGYLSGHFTDLKGLYIHGSFTDRVLSKVGPMLHRGCEGVTSSILARNMSDKEIIDEMLGGMDEVHSRAFTLDQVAAKIELQPGGEDGELLNSGHENIFYVLVDGVLLAISVHFGSDGRGWHMCALCLDENDWWDAGAQVFRNTILTV